MTYYSEKEKERREEYKQGGANEKRLAQYESWLQATKFNLEYKYGKAEGKKRLAAILAEEKAWSELGREWRAAGEHIRHDFIRFRLFMAPDLTPEEALWWLRYLCGERHKAGPLPESAVDHPAFKLYATYGRSAGGWGLTKAEWKEVIGKRVPFPERPASHEEFLAILHKSMEPPSEYEYTLAALEVHRAGYIAKGLLPWSRRGRGRPPNDRARAKFDGRRLYLPDVPCELHPTSGFRIRAGDCAECDRIRQEPYAEYHASRKQQK